jgi:hypothetical protein
MPYIDSRDLTSQDDVENCHKFRVNIPGLTALLIDRFPSLRT